MIECIKCQEYNPFSPKANKLGIETFWRAYDTETGQYGYGDTKSEALSELKSKPHKNKKENKTMNKKANMAYWDEIDDICYQAVKDIMKYSTSKLDEDELDDTITETGAEIRDLIIEALKGEGGKFPFVNENY